MEYLRRGKMKKDELVDREQLAVLLNIINIVARSIAG